MKLNYPDKHGLTALNISCVYSCINIHIHTHTHTHTHTHIHTSNGLHIKKQS